MCERKILILLSCWIFRYLGADEMAGETIVKRLGSPNPRAQAPGSLDKDSDVPSAEIHPQNDENEPWTLKSLEKRGFLVGILDHNL